MIRVGIVGASGYGGGELLRLLTVHPEFTVVYVASQSDAGKDVASVFSPMRGVSDLKLEPYDCDRALELADVFFLPVANGRAMKTAPALVNAGRKIVDFSADFRIKDAELYESTYGITHSCPELLEEAVYGLVEMNRDSIRSARLVANPGCYPTAAILSILPLLGQRDAEGEGRRGEFIVDPASIIVDAYSGVTGAGRTSLTLDYHFPEVNDSMTAYKVVGHRHTREIEQAISCCLGVSPPVTFTPHLAPIGRGILETVYATLTRDLNSKGLRDVYESFYADDPFVVVLPEGQSPRTGSVRGSNYLHIGVFVDDRMGRATILSAEDNLVKGAAGQAIQNMNLMCGLDETSGLKAPGLYP